MRLVRDIGAQAAICRLGSKGEKFLCPMKKISAGFGCAVVKNILYAS